MNNNLKPEYEQLYSAVPSLCPAAGSPAAGSPAGLTSIFLTAQRLKGDVCKSVDLTVHATNEVAKGV